MVIHLGTLLRGLLYFAIFQTFMSIRDLHANARILLHFTQFQLRRQKVHPPYGLWEHFFCSIWRDEELPLLEVDLDDTYLSQLCTHKKTSEGCKCHLFLGNKCIADHSCDLPDETVAHFSSPTQHFCFILVEPGASLCGIIWLRLSRLYG